MKRDMELIRNILLQFEERLEFDTPYTPEVVGYSENQIYYHLKLMDQAGLIEAIDWSGGDSQHWVVTSMTNVGHDFLEAARNETFWERAKSAISASGGVLTIEALKIALSTVVKKAMSSDLS